MAIFAFCHPILLRSIWTRSLRQNTFLLKIFLKLIRHILTTRVRAKFFNTCLKLSFNICQKFLKHRKHFRFRPKNIYPGKPTVIINKRDKIFIVSMRNYTRHTPHITMNQLKTSGSTMGTRWERKCFTFRQFANRT